MGMPVVIRLASILLSVLIAQSSTCLGESPSTLPDAPLDAASLRLDDGLKCDAAALAVMQHLQTVYYVPRTGLYIHSVTQKGPELMWGNGVMFSALVGAA